MSRIQVDGRTLHFERDDAALAELEALQPAWLESEIRLAYLFQRIDAKAAMLAASAESVEELASRRGYDGVRARELRDAGYALRGLPGLEAALRAREVVFPAVIAIGALYRVPERIEAGDDWLRWARLLRLTDLRRRVRQRIETHAHGKPAKRRLSVTVPEQTHEDFEKARTVASKKAGRPLTRGQTMTACVTNYLEDHDPEAGRPGARRMAPTGTLPTSRGVPAEVERAIQARTGGLCEVGDCERPGQEYCHLVPHRDGSAREVHDLFLGCWTHHTSYDSGLLHFVGWTDGSRCPIFRVSASGEILVPKPRPEAREVPDRPGWLWRAIGRRRRGRRVRRRTRDPRPPGGHPPASDPPEGGWPDEVRDRQAPSTSPSRGRRDPPTTSPDGRASPDASRRSLAGSPRGGHRPGRVPPP